MITPRFQLSQTENTLTINVRAPYCSLRELEVSVEDHVFIFICKPYYLRLHLPGQITENDNTNSKFDSDSGEFTFTYEKTVPGEEFPDLDFITKLLCSKVEVNEGGRKIEVISSKEDADKFEADVKYGFAMRGGYNFNYVSSEFSDLFEINPHEVELSKRSQIRIENENNAFSVDHYIADLIDCDEIQEFMHLKAPWADLSKSDVKFSAVELDLLKDLHNIEYNLSDSQKNFCYNSLLEILFAYCYDRRTTFNEGTCETGWTISKLSASFSCFDGFNTPKDAIICAFRRTLIYPLYREFELSSKVFDDLKLILKLGEKYILKCLIEIYQLFIKGDSSRYILNNLFIKDYITYVMKWDKESWQKTVDIVDKLIIQKTDLGLNLEEIEASIENEDEITQQLGKLTIKTPENLDSDDDSHSSSSDSESDSDDTSSSEEE